MKETKFFERLKRFCQKPSVVIVCGFIVSLFGFIATCFIFYRTGTISNFIDEYSSLKESAKEIYDYATEYMYNVWLCGFISLCFSIICFYNTIKDLIKFIKERKKSDERI